MSEKTIWTGIRRGLRCRCPECGRGHLFGGYLKLSPACPSCGADNTIYPSDDFPPYLTILIVGHIIVPLFMWVDSAFAPALWLQFAIWLPLTVALAAALLPPMKGATVGLCWATKLTRQVPSHS
jgi:uncharacterized protein (DUF983 family)